MTRCAEPENVIAGFRLVAPSLWEHIPEELTRFTCTSAGSILVPSHILLLSWTGARNEHISKYTNMYGTLFPTAHVFVVTTSTKDLCFRTPKRKQERMKALLEHLVEYEKCTNLRILMHVFSEGGSNKAIELAEAYHKETSHRLPVSALCLDSAPGHPRFLRLCNALKKSLPPHPILKHAGFVVGSTILGGMWILFCVFKGYENNPISKTRRQLLDPTYFDLRAPRCYLFSKADALVAWQDIQEHRDASIELEIPVMEVIFNNSQHCKHARAEPQLYWEAVRQTWRKAAARDGSKSVGEVDTGYSLDEPDWEKAARAGKY